MFSDGLWYGFKYLIRMNDESNKNRHKAATRRVPKILWFRYTPTDDLCGAARFDPYKKAVWKTENLSGGLLFYGSVRTVWRIILP